METKPDLDTVAEAIDPVRWQMARQVMHDTVPCFYTQIAEANIRDLRDAARRVLALLP